MASRSKNRRVWAGVGAALFGLLGLTLAATASAAEPDDPSGREPNLDPLDPDPDAPGMRKRIDQTICDCIDEGVAGDAALQRCVVAILWPDDPWPPVSGDHRSRARAWSLVAERITSYIQAALEGTGKKWCENARVTKFALPDPPDDPPDDPPGPPTPPRSDFPPIFEPKGVDLAPWESPDNYPRPEIFHSVVSGDIFLGTDSNRSIVYRALLSGAYQAAIDGGAADNAARTFAQSIANNPSKRMDYYNLILCSPWNDAVSGTWGYGEQALPGPHGRAIRMLKFHPDNRKRLTEGLPAMRNIERGDPSWRQQQPPREAKAIWQDAAVAFEYLWLPGIDLDALWSQSVIRESPEPWGNGDSRIMPPPAVTALGFSNVPPGVYGCPGLPTVSL